MVTAALRVIPPVLPLVIAILLKAVDPPTTPPKMTELAAVPEVFIVKLLAPFTMEAKLTLAMKFVLRRFGSTVKTTGPLKVRLLVPPVVEAIVPELVKVVVAVVIKLAPFAKVIFGDEGVYKTPVALR